MDAARMAEVGELLEAAVQARTAGRRAEALELLRRIAETGLEVRGRHYLTALCLADQDDFRGCLQEAAQELRAFPDSEPAAILFKSLSSVLRRAPPAPPAPPERIGDQAYARLREQYHPLSTMQGAKKYGARTGRCLFLDDSITLTPIGFAICCHWPTVVNFREPVEEAIEEFLKLKHRIAADLATDATRNRFCSTCSEFVEGEGVPPKETFRHFVVGNNAKCNLQCVYCAAHGGDQHVPLNTRLDRLAPLLPGIVEKYVTGPDVSFELGGDGEPILAAGFEESLEALLRKGGKGIVLTNCTIYSEAVAQGLKSGALVIRCSLDAGTREMYRAVKKVDFFDRVVANLERYARVNPRGIELKYILLDEHLSRPDVDAFIELCQRLQPKLVLVSRDVFLARKGKVESDELLALRDHFEARLRELGLPYTTMFPSAPEHRKAGKRPAAGEPAPPA